MFNFNDILKYFKVVGDVVSCHLGSNTTDTFIDQIFNANRDYLTEIGMKKSTQNHLRKIMKCEYGYDCIEDSPYQYKNLYIATNPEFYDWEKRLIEILLVIDGITANSTVPYVSNKGIPLASIDMELDVLAVRVEFENYAPIIVPRTDAIMIQQYLKKNQIPPSEPTDIYYYYDMDVLDSQLYTSATCVEDWSATIPNVSDGLSKMHLLPPVVDGAYVFSEEV